MSAPQHPNQPPPAQPPSGPFAAPDPTVAIGGPGAPGGPGNVDATQVVQGNDQPERTQVVRPGATPNGAISQQPEATQVVRPGAPQQQPQGSRSRTPSRRPDIRSRRRLVSVSSSRSRLATRLSNLLIRLSNLATRPSRRVTAIRSSMARRINTAARTSTPPGGSARSAA
jgi:hypothetical protein